MPARTADSFSRLLLVFLSGSIVSSCVTSGPPEGEEEIGPAEVDWSYKLTPDVVDSTQPLVEDGRVYAVAGHTLGAYDVDCAPTTRKAASAMRFVSLGTRPR